MDTVMMDSLLPSTTTKSKFHWFDIFLAGLCIFFSLFMIAGMGTSTSTVVRNTDASLGLLKRDVPFYFKNIEKIARLTNPINTNAQFVVSVAFDFAAALREIAILAFKFILKKILGFLLSSLRTILGDLLSSVKTWVKTLSGLLDSVKSFISALAIKVYAVQECSSKRSADVVSGIFGVSVSEADPDLASKCASGSGYNTSPIDINVGIGDEKIVNDLTRSQLNTFSNGLANLRVSSLLSDVAQATYPSNQLGATPSAGKGQNTTVASSVLAERELAAKTDELANSIGYIKCARITPVKGYSYSSLTSYNPDCSEATISAAEAINQVRSQDKAALQSAKTNINTTAPSDCKQNGFITAAPGANNATSGLAYTALSNKIADVSSFAAGAVSYSSTFAVNTLTAEQCNNSNQFNALQTSIPTQVSASKDDSNVAGSLDSALQGAFDETVNALVNEITNILNDFVQKVFKLVIDLVVSFVDSLPGGEFLSSSLTSSLSNSRDDIRNKITQTLNEIRPQP
jgi:hypothetical protein